MPKNKESEIGSVIWVDATADGSYCSADELKIKEGYIMYSASSTWGEESAS